MALRGSFRKLGGSIMHGNSISNRKRKVAMSCVMRKPTMWFPNSSTQTILDLESRLHAGNFGFRK